MSGIDGNFGPLTGPTEIFTPPIIEGDTEAADPHASTISQSLAEALMVSFLMGNPILADPNSESVGGVDAAEAAVGAAFAKIGSEMWDHYLDHLAEQKERIMDYLASPAYRQFVEERTMEGQVHERLSTSLDVQSVLRSMAEYEEYLDSRHGMTPELIEEEMRKVYAMGAWSNLIDGAANYIDANRDSSSDGAMFIAASFVISSTFIGDYANIVDIASTDMVGANPIQNAPGSLLDLVPPELQQSFALTINLFAVGMINFSNAEAIGLSEKTGNPPTSWDTAVAYANEVLNKVQGNMVNTVLMALFVNNMEALGETEQEQTGQLSRLALMAKAVMLATAMAAVLKTATGVINGDTFLALVNEPLEARSEEDEEVVKVLSPLVEYFNSLRSEGIVLESEFDKLMEALGLWLNGNPDFENITNPTQIYAGLAQHLRPEEQRG